MAGTDDVASRGSVRHRLPRSRNGCLTCRRRKVRCNEQRPRCGHCERLDLQCVWRLNKQASGVSQDGSLDQPRQQSLSQSSLDPAADNLDFNNILWEGTLDFESPGFEWSSPVDTQSVRGAESTRVQNLLVTDAQNAESNSCLIGDDPSHIPDVTQMSPASWASTNPVLDVERNNLVEHFLASVVPPILAAVETGPRWTSTKVLLISLAATSDMVQDSIAAFSALQLGDDKSDAKEAHQLYYDRAKEHVLRYVEPQWESLPSFTDNLASVLVAVFFLSYCALLGDHVEDAHQLLQRAAQLVGRIPSEQLNSTTKRLISWIRLVDGRASSAGGSGLFLSETDRQAQNVTESADRPSSGSLPGKVSDDIEEILFDMLYTPGLIFYQRVQSIMARVSAIDKWHRSRGTVKDETEVMTLAAQISNDLLTIEQQRPALMDSAVAGNLTERYLMAGLSSAIVRSYRTYWANYQAGHIHLHRVAYIHLEASAEVLHARATIKTIARQLEKSHDQLPANLIWPLLMACAEEDDPNERAWMVAAIRAMQSSATNAKPIAHVLEELHRRQDATRRRADIRQTSIDLFNKSFAVF